MYKHPVAIFRVNNKNSTAHMAHSSQTQPDTNRRDSQKTAARIAQHISFNLKNKATHVEHCRRLDSSTSSCVWFGVLCYFLHLFPPAPPPPNYNHTTTQTQFEIQLIDTLYTIYRCAHYRIRSVITIYIHIDIWNLEDETTDQASFCWFCWIFLCSLFRICVVVLSVLGGWKR